MDGDESSRARRGHGWPDAAGSVDREVADRPADRLVAVVTRVTRVPPGCLGKGDAAARGRRLRRQTVTMTGTIIGRWRVRSPTSRPMVRRATRLSVSWSLLPELSASSRALVNWARASSSTLSVVVGMGPTAGHDLGGAHDFPAFEVDGGHRHDHALFGQHHAIA